MDPHSFIARAEAQRWLGIAEKLLMSHDLVGSKTFAIRARDSDPRLEAADQILAIADTLLAAEKRVVGNNGAQQPDFYAILQLVRFAQDTEHITSQYRRLAVILNPHQNRFPYSDQAFQLVNDAWAVLSNPLRKSMYDSELDFPQQQQQQMNTLGFNLEQQQHHHHHNHNQHQQHHHQQQQQHNFFSINHMSAGHEQELAEPQQTFQSRVQHSHQQQQQQQQQQLQQHNFLSQPNPVRPLPVVREQEQLFQHRDQEQLFQPTQVQPFQVTSAPQQQNRPSPQPPPQTQIPMRQPTPPPQPQPSIQSPTPPPPAAPPQPPFSWPQAPPLTQPQPQPQKQQKQHLQPQPQPQPFTLTHSQPQPQIKPQSHSQSQQQQQMQQQFQEKHQEEEQEESLEQNVPPVQLSSEDNNGNNGVRDEEMEREREREREREAEEVAEEEVDDGSPTFWTACPYCFYMYEYPKVYVDCTLRCDNCKRAFQAVRISSPPPIIEGQEACFYCWGFFPVGVSMSHLEKNNGKGTKPKWTPFSPLYETSSNVQDHLNDMAAPKPKKNFVVNKNSGPRVYIDDVTEDIFMGISDPSDSSDLDAEWNSTKKKKVKRMKKGLKRGRKKRAHVVAVRVSDGRNGSNKDLQNGNADQEGVGVLTEPVAEVSKKAVGSNPRRQSGLVAKELGKLDLNVEFNNNEGEEPAPRMTVGNRGHGQGEDDNIEGIGFFEGLDEFLSSLPILNVVNEEKIKAA